jgi:hypothetical protein
VLDDVEGSGTQKMTKSLSSAGSSVVNMIIKVVKYGCHVGSLLYARQDIKWQFQWFDLLVKLLLISALKYTLSISGIPRNFFQGWLCQGFFFGGGGGRGVQQTHLRTE